MIEISKKSRLLLSLISGLLMAISFPFSGSLTLVVFVSWVPLLLIEDYISTKRYRSRMVFFNAYLAFFIYNITTTWWVWNASGGGAALAIILNSLLMAIAFQLFHFTKKHIGKKEGYISLFIYWIAFEYFHYNWEMSWTWLSLGNTFSITPSWVQWYSYTGVLGGTFWILLINLVVFKIYKNVLFKKETWRIQTPLIWSAAFLFILPLSISLVTYFSYTEKINPIEVIAVQPNIDPYNEKFVPGGEIKQLEKITRLAKSKITKSTDLIVAPETAMSYGFTENSVLNENGFNYLVDFQQKTNNIPWCIGASTWKTFHKKNSRASHNIINSEGFYESYNTAVAINKSNQPGFIHKSKLVPGVEVIPFSDLFPFLEDLSIQNGGASGTLGIEEEPLTFVYEEFQLAPVICYESIYGEWVAQQCRKGANLIAIITNDGWWKDTPGYKQHVSFASLRAIENRRSIVRSANTGTSCFVNQRGDILQATKWWEEDVIRGTLNLNNEQTFYTLYGDVMGRSFAFVAVLLIIFTFVKRFKKNHETTK
jgi:apolipoprotein N-acyltransferase